MTDARWADVEDAITAAVRHFTDAARLFDDGGSEADGLSGHIYWGPASWGGAVMEMGRPSSLR